MLTQVNTATSSTAQVDRPLTLTEVVTDMIDDKLISKETGEQYLTNRRSFSSKEHPLVLIAGQKWKDARDPRKMLHLEVLTQWLANRCHMEYVHVDPFKVDFAAVTKVMSNAYAERYKILPVAVSSAVADRRRRRVVIRVLPGWWCWRPCGQVTPPRIIRLGSRGSWVKGTSWRCSTV